MPLRSQLVGFGADLLLAQADALRGREALAKLHFYVHIDLSLNPTAEMADILLPAASAFERAALKIGFELDQESMAHAHFRQRMVPLWIRRLWRESLQLTAV